MILMQLQVLLSSSKDPLHWYCFNMQFKHMNFRYSLIISFPIFIVCGIFVCGCVHFRTHISAFDKETKNVLEGYLPFNAVIFLLSSATKIFCDPVNLFLSIITAHLTGRLLFNTLVAYSRRNFWKAVVSDSSGGPVLSCEHCTIHFL